MLKNTVDMKILNPTDFIRPDGNERNSLKNMSPKDGKMLQYQNRGIEKTKKGLFLNENVFSEYALMRFSLFYVSCEKQYYCYNERLHVWCAVDAIFLKRLYKNILNEAGKVYSVAWDGRILSALDSTIDYFNSKPETERVWVFPNGVLSMETLEFKEFEDVQEVIYNYSVMPYNYDPEATAPVFEAFVADLFWNDQKMVDLIQELFAYALEKNYSPKALMVYLYGSGANGKSLMLSVLRGLFPDDEISTQSIQNLSSQFGLASVVGKSICCCPDLSGNDIVDSSVFKAISSGDPVDVEHKYQDRYSAVLHTKFWVASNHPLKTSNDQTLGMWRRVLTIPMTKRFLSPDDANYSKDDCGVIDLTLGEKLAAEKAGVLNWAIRGLKKLRMDNYEFLKHPKCEKLKEEFILGNSVIYHFASTCVSRLEGNQIATSKVHELFEDWCNENELEYSQFANNRAFHKAFAQVLRSIGLPYVKKKNVIMKYYDIQIFIH